MKVHTYYFPIPDSGAEPVIEMWRESWKKNGWEPVVLGEDGITKLPFYNMLSYKTRQLPTINDWRYERACYMRWLALAGIGGGMMTDYDVMNYGFRPEHLPAYKGKLIRLNRQSPCAVFGRMWDYLAVVDMFLNYTVQSDDLYGNNLVVEDMTILNRYAGIADYHDLCSEFRHDKGMPETPLVHFCTHGLPKTPDGNLSKKNQVIKSVTEQRDKKK
jgi:hypothetical protein